MTKEITAVDVIQVISLGGESKERHSYSWISVKEARGKKKDLNR
jgi:hypothetical protein